MGRMANIAGACILGALLIAGCSEASDNVDDTKDTLDEAQDDSSSGFNDSYVKRFVRTCTPAAVNAGSPRDIAEMLCECTATKAVETLDKSKIIAGAPEDFQPIAEECASELKAEMGGANG